MAARSVWSGLLLNKNWIFLENPLIPAKGLQTCVRIVVKDTASPLDVKDRLASVFLRVCLKAETQNPF